MGLTEHNTDQSHDHHLHMLALVDTTMLTLEVNEKEQAPLGQRMCAVGIRGVARILQSGGHTVPKRGFSPGFIVIITTCCRLFA